MANPPDVFTTTLSKPVTLDALNALRDEVTRALERGAPAVLVDIDGVGTLESATIAGLIVLLRAARERGAVLSLRVGRKNLLDTLRITALDRIFPIVTPLDAARVFPRGSLRSARGRGAASIVAGIALIAVVCGTRAEARGSIFSERGFVLSHAGQKSV